MGGGGSDVEAADVRGAAEVEAEARRQAAQEELWGNRANQTGPMGSTIWTNQMVDANTGRPIVMGDNGEWAFADGGGSGGPTIPRPADVGEPRSGESWIDFDRRREAVEREQRNWDQQQRNGEHQAAGIDSVQSWEQTTTLTPEWQAILEQQQGLIGEQSAYRSGVAKDWSANPNDFSDIGGSNLQGTISRGDLGQFGQNSANMGAQDWRQFGTTEQTIGANQWQNQGNSDPTLGADDWRQFGTTDQTLSSGDFDARFGGDDQSGGFGDHGMGGSDWDTVQYSPEALRNKAEQQTLDFMNAQLDPQWDTRQNDMEIKLTNQGLQPGDAAWDNAMSSLSKSRDTAYSGARNQALADSRAEANMLWGQEMQRSDQKNMQTQSDLDNIYRARQSNIQNYQTQRGQDMQGYLDYQNSAFDQDFQIRNQQLQADLDYGNSAFDQDFRSRQQSLDAQLGYGREAWNQDFQGRQQQLDANRLYSQEAFNQDLQARQSNISNYLNFGQQEFDQSLSAQELDLRARAEQERLEQGRYGLMNPNETINTVTSALG